MIKAIMMNAHWSLVRSRLVFNYQACVDIKGSQAQREEAQVDHYHQIHHNDHNQMISSYDDHDDYHHTDHHHSSVWPTGRRGALTTLWQ